MTIKDFISTLNDDQKDIFNILNNESKYQFRVPTGVGKGYVMISHIFYDLFENNKSNVAISSHRLSLNNQHLRDLLEKMVDLELVGQIGFITVGSDSLNIKKALSKIDPDKKRQFNIKLRNLGITKDDLFKRTLRQDEVKDIVNENLNEGRKNIIISTYHSLDKLSKVNIDNIYLDECHILASERDEAEFKENFEKVKFDKSFFFSATPKDLQEIEEADNAFLMNNTDIFGDKYELSFKHCVEKGYIVNPVIHIAQPSNLDYNLNFENVENKAKFIKETFTAHKQWINNNSCDPSEINPKILVRCASVEEMWKLHSKLVDINGIRICAGASYNESEDYGNFNHYIDNEGIRDRDEFLKKIQDFNNNQDVIILNVDIFSEGINVPGITGVMFLQGKMPSKAKTIQNIGRATRLHKMDRDRLISGEIGTDDFGKWVKPSCACIIPYWDKSSEFTKNILSSRIRELRDEYGFDPSFMVSIGDDLCDGEDSVDIDALNNVERGGKKYIKVEDVENEIEKLDLDAAELAEAKRLGLMSNKEKWEKFVIKSDHKHL